MKVTRRDFLKTMSAVAATSAGLGLAGCNSSSSSDSGSTSGGSVAGGNSIAVCLASEPDTIDPALNSAVDGATMIVHLFSGLAKWTKNGDSYEIVADCAEELPEGVLNDDGTTTYTYTLKSGLKWSDGQDLTANDFVFSWNRAVSVDLAADYGYMFENVDGYDAIWGDEPDPDATLNISAPDDTTFVVTLSTDVPYWNELLAFPTFFPVREDVVADEAWATDPSTYVSNGAYTMTGWEHNSVITVEKNEYFHDVDEVTMDAIEFYLSDDANNMLSNFENGTWQLIDSVPTNEIATLKESYPDEFHIDGQLGTYYIGWNVNQNILPSDSTLEGAEAEAARAEIRNALSLLIDRNYIAEEIGQAGQQPASSFVASGLTDAAGGEFYENAGHSDDYVGYYDVSEDALQSNYDEAIETLKKYYDYDEDSGTFTNVPSMTYLYNTDEGHKAIAEYVQSAWAQVGVTINLDNQEWNTFLNTRKAGDYTVARNGWLCDYNDPISMLDMWTTASGNNDCQFGKGDNATIAAYSVDCSDIEGYEDFVVDGGTWAETYDTLIADIKTESDNDKRYLLMHKAEDLLMSTGAINPIYYYTDIYMVDSSIDGFFSIPLGYKFFTYSSYSA